MAVCRTGFWTCVLLTCTMIGGCQGACNAVGRVIGAAVVDEDIGTGLGDPADVDPEYMPEVPEEGLFLKSWVGLWRFCTDTE